MKGPAIAKGDATAQREPPIAAAAAGTGWQTPGIAVKALTTCSGLLALQNAEFAAERVQRFDFTQSTREKAPIALIFSRFPLHCLAVSGEHFVSPCRALE